MGNAAAAKKGDPAENGELKPWLASEVEVHGFLFLIHC
jgi:hypothetical protein